MSNKKSLKSMLEYLHVLLWLHLHVKIIIIIPRLYFGYTNLESIKILGVDPAKRFLLFLNYCDSNISLFSRN